MVNTQSKQVGALIIFLFTDVSIPSQQVSPDQFYCKIAAILLRATARLISTNVLILSTIVLCTLVILAVFFLDTRYD